MKKKDLILGAGIIVIALAMLLVMQLTRGEEGNQIPGYAGWENLWNVFLVEGSDHRSKGWRFL